MNVKNEMPTGSVTSTSHEVPIEVVDRADEEARVLEVGEQAEVERDCEREEGLARGRSFVDR